MAMTVDGKIGRSSNHFANWTSLEDKKHFFKTTRNVGTMIMGRNTFETLPSILKERTTIVLGRGITRNENVIFYNDKIENIREFLISKGIKEAILCGGEYANSSMLKVFAIDELMITIEPRIFGDGLGLFKGFFDRQLKLLSIEKLNSNSILLHYKLLN